MSRAGYTEDFDDHWQHIKYRGAVKAALRGRRGQAFLREMLAALDAMPVKRLVTEDLERDGEVCVIGSVGRARGIDMSKLDPDDYASIAGCFGLAEAMVREIEYLNDEEGPRGETDEQRFERLRAWVAMNILEDVADPLTPPQGGKP